MAAAALVAALAWTAAGSGAPGDPKRAFTRADQAAAKASLLRKADLPAASWRSSPADFSQPNPPCFVKHFNLSALTETGEAGLEYESPTVAPSRRRRTSS